MTRSIPRTEVRGFHRFSSGITRATPQFLYAPSGAKIAKMNGQTLVRGSLPLPSGLAIFKSTGLFGYTHNDWLGTARFFSSSTRGLVYDDNFAPYGENNHGTGSGGTLWQFAGIVAYNHDLWGTNTRSYEDVEGRWISPDPAGLAAVNPMNPQTWNRYAYVGGNPLSAVDPAGLDFNDARGCTVGCGGGGVYADPFSAVTDASQRDLAIDFGGAWLDYQTQDFRTRAGLLSPMQEGLRDYLGSVSGYRKDPDTGDLEQIIGWQTRNPLNLDTGEATPTLVPVWGDYTPTLIAGNVVPPGMNGPLQAEKQATRGYPEVSRGPQQMPGKWEPPSKLEDFLDDASKQWKRLIDMFPGFPPGTGFSIFVTGNPCLTDPNAMRTCVRGGGPF